jgi:ketosteroid isomerase-like protein
MENPIDGSLSKKEIVQMNYRRYSLAVVAVTAACVASSCSSAGDEAEINASVQRLVAAVNAKDINGIMAYYTPDESLLVFDAVLPRQYVGAAAFRKSWEAFLAAYSGAVHAEVSDWKTEAQGSLAYGRGVFRAYGMGPDGNGLDITVRITDVYRKINGKWLAVHEHVSWPVDFATGKADLSSKP